jgi:hypothetical protein
VIGRDVWHYSKGKRPWVHKSEQGGQTAKLLCRILSRYFILCFATLVLLFVMLLGESAARGSCACGGGASYGMVWLAAASSLQRYLEMSCWGDMVQ